MGLIYIADLTVTGLRYQYHQAGEWLEVIDLSSQEANGHVILGKSSKVPENPIVSDQSLLHESKRALTIIVSAQLQISGSASGKLSYSVKFSDGSHHGQLTRHLVRYLQKSECDSRHR